MVDPSIWNKEVDVPKDVICYVDSNVSSSSLPITPKSETEARADQSCLPTTVELRSIRSSARKQNRGHIPTWSELLGTHGKNTNHAGGWKPVIILSQGVCIRFLRRQRQDLMKTSQVLQDDTGKGMVSGEFASMSVLYNTMPDLVAKPIAWGTYASNPNMHFFLCTFHVMTGNVPDIETFTGKIAELHKKGISPNGKFGFSVINYPGRLPQDTTWCDTWEGFFSRNLKHMMGLEEESQGYNEEMKRLCDAILAKVVPRLLRPMETEGRQIQPRLIHGDLWDGNTSTDAATNNPIIFDAITLYAHNEYELGPWRPTRHEIGQPYIRAYLKRFPASVPKEDFDDRNALYCIVMEEMRVLVEKFPDGYEGWVRQKEEELSSEIPRTPGTD